MQITKNNLNQLQLKNSQKQQKNVSFKQSNEQPLNKSINPTIEYAGPVIASVILGTIASFYAGAAGLALSKGKKYIAGITAALGGLAMTTISLPSAMYHKKLELQKKSAELDIIDELRKKSKSGIDSEELKNLTTSVGMLNLSSISRTAR